MSKDISKIEIPSDVQSMFSEFTTPEVEGKGTSPSTRMEMAIANMMGEGKPQRNR